MGCIGEHQRHHQEWSLRTNDFPNWTVRFADQVLIFNLCRLFIVNVDNYKFEWLMGWNKRDSVGKLFESRAKLSAFTFKTIIHDKALHKFRIEIIPHYFCAPKFEPFFLFLHKDDDPKKVNASALISQNMRCSKITNWGSLFEKVSMFTSSLWIGNYTTLQRKETNLHEIVSSTREVSSAIVLQFGQLIYGGLLDQHCQSL